jgi:toxin ParE1/3/4
MRFELSRSAQADLDGIRDYSIEHFGPERTLLYLDAIEQAFRRIIDHPEIGALQADFAERLRGMSVGVHRLFYRVDTDAIIIVRILHKAMDVSRWL